MLQDLALFVRRKRASIVLVAAIYSLAPVAARDVTFEGSNRLVMVDDVGCVVCARWDRDVKEGYEASPEGRFAPLLKVRIGSPDLSGLSRLAYTPTFVLIMRGEEVGRIVGYAGADFFWAEIDRLYAKAGFHRDDTPGLRFEDRVDVPHPTPLPVSVR